MYCQNCGQENPSNTNVCINCGEKIMHPVLQQGLKADNATPSENLPNNSIETVSAPVQGQYEQNSFPQPAKKKSKKGIIAVACAALAVIIAAAAIFFVKFSQTSKNNDVSKSGTSDPETVAEKFILAALTYDTKSYKECFHEKVLKSRADGKGLSVDEYVKSDSYRFREKIIEMEDRFGKITIKAEAVGSKKLSNEKYYDFKTGYKNTYNLEVEDAREVDVEITLKPEDLNLDPETFTTQIYVVKIGSRWYVI